MPAPEHRRHTRLLFAAFIICSLACAFAIGHLTGRWTMARHYARFTHDPPGQDQMEVIGKFIIRSAETIRVDEYMELCEAIERYRQQAPPEQQAGIDATLSVMRERRAERASQRPTVEYITEGK